MFPETVQALFIGGPKHGEYLEVVKDDPTWKVLSPPRSNGDATLFSVPAAEVHTYVKRTLGAQTADGETYTRDVYVHEDCPSPDMAERLLTQALMLEFLKRGRKVVTVDGVSDVSG